MRRLALLVALAACSSPAKPVTTTTTPVTGAVTEEQFKAMHELPPEAPAARAGKTIDIEGTRAYLSLPDGPGPFPTIIVIHEWWGLNGHIEIWADRLASAGWAAIAVDLYGGKVATTRDEALALLKAVDERTAEDVIANALVYAAADPRMQATPRAVIGWCFGGGWSLHTALQHPELAAAIVYYGSLELDPAKLAAFQGQLLGIFGTRDDGIPISAVDEFDAALTAAKVRHEIIKYDAEHGFANPSNPKYDAANAGAAWAKVLALLGSIAAQPR